METASRIVLSYPADLSRWGREILDDTPFRTYLRKAHDEAVPGDSWSEFVGVGCCGSALDVELRVAEVTGGSTVDDTTEFVFVEREACTVGGWQVQSRTGPSGKIPDSDDTE